MKPLINLCIVFILLSFLNCGIKKSTVLNERPQEFQGNLGLSISFGSCNDVLNEDYGAEQPIWKAIKNTNPDLWIWLGDIIYADIRGQQVDSLVDIERMRIDYNNQKKNPGYMAIYKNVQVMGMYDDHDYGDNNAGKEFPFKQETRDLLYDFLDIPENEEARQKEGAYYSSDMVANGISVRTLLLDTRYFRDEPVKKGRKYLPEETKGDILGEAQWAWLERKLSEKVNIDLYIIGSGIQMIPEDHRFEKWANFPIARKRLFNLLEKHNSKNIILVSGDRHIAEISKQTVGDKEIYEITASGMTHSYDSFTSEVNHHRVGDVVSSLNFGNIKVSHKANDLKAELSIGTLEGLTQTVEIDLID